MDDMTLRNMLRNHVVHELACRSRTWHHNWGRTGPQETSFTRERRPIDRRTLIPPKLRLLTPVGFVQRVLDYLAVHNGRRWRSVKERQSAGCQVIWILRRGLSRVTGPGQPRLMQRGAMKRLEAARVSISALKSGFPQELGKRIPYSSHAQNPLLGRGERWHAGIGVL
jgi:hypothetical protein